MWGLNKVIILICERVLQMTEAQTVSNESKTEIRPSPEARRLYNKMVAWGKENYSLSLVESFELGVHMKRNNNDARVQALAELEDENWIQANSDGGWYLA